MRTQTFSDRTPLLGFVEAASGVPCARCGAEVPVTARFCAMCGAPRGDLLPRRVAAARGSLALAVLAFVLAAAVLSAAMYFLVLRPAPATTPTKPTVQLNLLYANSGGAAVSVVSVSRAVGMTNLHFGLSVDGVYGVASSLTPTYPEANVTIGGDAYIIFWYDSDGGGTLTAGDQFSITNGEGIFASMTSINFSLLWEDGSTLASVAFQTP